MASLRCITSLTSRTTSRGVPRTAIAILSLSALPHHQQQHRRLLNYLSSPAKETLWISQNGPHARRGGAMLAANMSPTVQRIAAEEGLLTWGQALERLECETKEVVAVTKPAVKAVERTWGPKTSEQKEGKASERDDTPGLVAFSAILLLPLAFQVGRYVEGADAPAADVVSALVPAETEGVDAYEMVEEGKMVDTKGKWSGLFWDGGRE